MFKNKKAIMGIGTLIIFIAMVLVAAVAASVLIRTSGVLQERSFAVANSARKALVNQIDIVSVSGLVNTSKRSGYETIYGLEIRAKLGPGSYPIQLKSVHMEFISEDANLGAVVAMPLLDTLAVTLDDIVNNTPMSLGDISGDEFTDYVSLIATGGADFLRFNFSEGFMSDVYLESTTGSYYDLASVPQQIIARNLPIRHNRTIVGFVNVVGTQTTANELNSSQVSVSLNESSSVCDIDHVIPETKFCYPVITHILDDDTIMEPGEVFLFKYRLLPEHEIPIETEFDISLIPKSGSEARKRITSPDVLNRPRVHLWPD